MADSESANLALNAPSVKYFLDCLTSVPDADIKNIPILMGKWFLNNGKSKEKSI